MRKIPLSQGKFALVDDDDYDFLIQWKWYAHKERESYYAVRKSVRLNGKQKMIYMHHILLGTPVGMKCDHQDRNSLNNQRRNLRIATNAQNLINRPSQSNNKLGIKGVYRVGNKFRASIIFKGKTIHLGAYSSLKEAGKAYDRKAKELFGDFAWLNFP